MDISAQFSKDLKIQKWNYIDEQTIDTKSIEQHLSNLTTMDLKNLVGDDAKKAFWINVYNGLTNYLIITKGIKKQMKEQPTIFTIPKINIGGYQFSLDSIEHGLLRRNPFELHRAYRYLLPTDKRLQFMVEKLDYRIHFALNCGAKSCPPIAFYTVEAIDNQLELASDVFEEQSFFVDDKLKSIRCSAIYKWYQRDFENVYLDDVQYKNYTVKAMDYDWSIA